MRHRCEHVRSARLNRSLRADDSGIALIYVTMALPVIIGFALLAIDVGRFSTLNSSLQHGADAVALAGAAELDGRSDAIQRSENAMQQFITTNKAVFATTPAVVDYRTCYLATLPASDATPINSSDCLPASTPSDKASSSPRARYVQVKAIPKTYTTIFPARFVGALTNSFSTDAEAVAGFKMAACNFTPLFMCNPYEPTSGTVGNSYDDYGLFTKVQDPTERRKAIRFIEASTNNNTTAVPGQYGYLQPYTGTGTNALGDEIASASPSSCFFADSLQTSKSGGMTSLVQAFNTRFDLYKGSYTKPADYPPATNVRKGYKTTNTNKCCGDLQTPDTGFMGLPVDSCFATSSCSFGNRVGNGDWAYEPDAPSGTGTTVSFTQYWNTNFSGRPVPSPADLKVGTSTTPYTGATGATPDTPPRYDIYKYENETVLPNGKSLSTNASTGGETGAPIFGTGSTASDRRILYGAIINCRAEGLSPGGGSYRALAFGKFFMLRPMNDPPSNTLWVELVDIARPGDGTGVARDLVQLYR